ncbi:MAG TPA: hypothetical protein VMT62_17140 [Syntrophorhabdaceae bacterium]|nr:hypothetical protein [Syntrophorhabdaceae bacterium]
MSEISIKRTINATMASVLSESGVTRNGANGGDKEKVCKGFESYFMLTMLKELQKTTELSKKKGYMEETYMSIVYQKVADFLADKGIGIKDMLMRYADRGNSRENSQENTKVSKQSGDNTGK